MKAMDNVPESSAIVREPGSTVASERFHALDAVRAFALLLGVVYHAAASFHPIAGRRWIIADSSPSPFLALIHHACHSFRLEIFFLIAGFFAHLVYHRRGAREFVRNRVSRILIPFGVGWVLLYPLLVCIWLLGGSVSGRLAQMGIPPEFAHTPLPLLVVGFFASGQFLQHFDLTHLWFLHQLLILYVLFLLLRWGWRQFLDRKGAWTSRVDSLLATLWASPWNSLLLAAVTTPMLMQMRRWNEVDTPKDSLLPHWPTTLLFGFQFGLGWLLHRQPTLLACMERRWRTNLLVGVVMLLLNVSAMDTLQALGVRNLGQAWLHWGYSGLYAMMMWSFVMGFIGLFMRYCSQPSPRWRYVADSSYWIYLVHLPLVVLLQILVAKWPLHWAVKFPFILAVSFPLLFLSYHYCVRSTFIGVQLNGRKR